MCQVTPALYRAFPFSGAAVTQCYQLWHILYSNHACSNIVGHIAGEMRAEIVQHIVTSQSKLSILVDESTSVSNVQSMVVYIRMMFDGEICTYFLGLVPVTEKQLLLALRQHL